MFSFRQLRAIRTNENVLLVADRLARIGLDQVHLAALNHQRPDATEIMAEAEPVIRAAIPDATCQHPSVNGTPVTHGSALDLGQILDAWLAAHADGIACVIGDPVVLESVVAESTVPATPRVRSLTPELAKGLEFDLTLLLHPRRSGRASKGQRWTAMPRSPGPPSSLSSSRQPERGHDGHAVVIAGGGPTGMMLAAELALARVDVAIVERRATQDLAGSRAGGLQARTIEVLDQRGVADRFLSKGQVMQVTAFAAAPLDISDFPTRHNYGLALWQDEFERILAAWVEELGVTFLRGREVTGFAQDDTGVDVTLSDDQALRAKYLVGCDGGRSLIRKKAGIDFPGWDPSITYLIAECEMAAEPPWGLCRDERGVHGLGKLDGGKRVRLVSNERHVKQRRADPRRPARGALRRRGAATSASTTSRSSRGSAT